MLAAQRIETMEAKVRFINLNAVIARAHGEGLANRPDPE
jgi:hypothetical protein